MNEQAPKFRRKQIVVEKKIQYRFAAFVMLFTVGTAFLTSASVFFATFSLLGERLANVYPQGRLEEIFRTVYLMFAAILIVAVPVIFYLSLKFSHRIVGPLPKIYRFLRSVGQGDFKQRITLRRNDELLELAQVLNEMTDALEKKYPSGSK